MSETVYPSSCVIHERRRAVRLRVAFSILKTWELISASLRFNLLHKDQISRVPGYFSPGDTETINKYVFLRKYSFCVSKPISFLTVLFHSATFRLKENISIKADNSRVPEKMHRINFNQHYLRYFFMKSFVWPLVRIVSMRRF